MFLSGVEINQLMLKLLRCKISPVMMNLKDVPDMNVGDMVNECTSGVNASYTTHVTDAVVPYMTRYCNFRTRLYD